MAAVRIPPTLRAEVGGARELDAHGSTVAEVIAAFALEKSWVFAATIAVGTLLPLSLIWFPEFFGGLTGWGTRARVDQPTRALFFPGP